MSRKRVRRRCTDCRRHTKSVTRQCERCRTGRVPAVTAHANGVHVEGLGVLDHQVAIALAHKLADALTP